MSLKPKKCIAHAIYFSAQTQELLDKNIHIFPIPKPIYCADSYIIILFRPERWIILFCDDREAQFKNIYYK